MVMTTIMIMILIMAIVYKNNNSENKKKNNNYISNNNTRGAYTNKQHSLAVDAYRLQANIILTTTASGLFPA